MNTFREAVRTALESTGSSSPEDIAETVKDTYPDITLEDATRIRDGLGAIVTAKTQEEARRRRSEYKALHDELRKKYKKR